MTSLRLRKPCEHDRYDEHLWWDADKVGTPDQSCLGGEFLPEDAVVIEKEDGEWPGWFGWWLWVKLQQDFGEVEGDTQELADDYGTSLVAARAKALADQVGEPA